MYGRTRPQELTIQPQFFTLTSMIATLEHRKASELNLHITNTLKRPHPRPSDNPHITNGFTFSYRTYSPTPQNWFRLCHFRTQISLSSIDTGVLRDRDGRVVQGDRFKP